MKINDEINQLINEGITYTFSNNCEKKSHGIYTKASPDFLAWMSAVEHFIITNYSKESVPYQLFKSADLKLFTGYNEHHFDKPYDKILGSLKACLRIKPIDKMDCNSNVNLFNIFQHFHLVVRQLRSRHNSRATLDVTDEYDVQDLLHALLRLFYKDIRDEEWTPSYAGGSSRMDFLLKEQKTVIEVKMTRKGLDDKELGKQLIEDKSKYQAHPDCKTLICFVYDPGGRIMNPQGIENDLNHKDDNFQTIIVIKP